GFSHDEVALPRPRRRDLRAEAFSAASLVVFPAHDQGPGDPAQDLRFGDRRPCSFHRSQRLRLSRYAPRCPDAGEHRNQDHRVLLIVAMASDPFSLEGKVAFVTGASSGLGLTVALSLRDAGAQVAVGARRVVRNAKALASLGPSAAALA